MKAALIATNFSRFCTKISEQMMYQTGLSYNAEGEAQWLKGRVSGFQSKSCEFETPRRLELDTLSSS